MTDRIGLSAIRVCAREGDTHAVTHLKADIVSFNGPQLMLLAGGCACIIVVCSRVRVANCD